MKICILWWNFIFYHDISLKSIIHIKWGNFLSETGWERWCWPSLWKAVHLEQMGVLGSSHSASIQAAWDSWNPVKYVPLSYLQTLSDHTNIYVKMRVSLLHWCLEWTLHGSGSRAGKWGSPPHPAPPQTLCSSESKIHPTGLDLSESQVPSIIRKTFSHIKWHSYLHILSNLKLDKNTSIFVNLFIGKVECSEQNWGALNKPSDILTILKRLCL